MASRPVLVAATARDPFVSEVVRLLRSEGSEVLVAHDAETALRMARTKRPAVAVLDTVLQNGDGLSLCRRLKEATSTNDIPVFFFSVLMARDRCLEAGAEDFMSKPIEQDLLLERILGIINSSVRQLPHRQQ